MKTPKRKRDGFLLLAALVFLPLSGCYATSRLLSPWNDVKVFADGAANDRLVDSPSSTLRIAAYNIAHGRGTGSDNWNGGDKAEREQRLRDIARFLRDANLDIVVLNEVDFDSSWSHRVNQAEFLAREAGFPFHVEQRNIDAAIPLVSWRFGNAILSRYPISSARLIDFPAYSQWETVVAGKKQGVVCTIDLPDGRQVRVLAVHLSHRSETVRVESARIIERERQRAGPPLIAAGDFNSTPLSFPHSEVDQTGQSALSLLLEQQNFTTSVPAQPTEHDLTFSSLSPKRVIDWILVSSPLEMIAREVYPLRLSDHRPVVGVVRWKPDEQR